MKIQLSDHFTYSRLLRFTLPSIIMMVFTSIYGVVDGLFVSNIVGSNALSSINIIFPAIMVIGSVGFMLGAGGSAEVARALGEGENQKANQYFTTLILTILIAGTLLSALGITFIRPLSYLLGASDLLIDDCITYGRILMLGCTFFMLQFAFQTFFVVAQKPNLGLILTILSGITNMILDFVFISMMKMGIAGAAWATIIGYMVGGVIPLFYFYRLNKSALRFAKTKFYGKMLVRSCGNGLSEMVSNISMSVVTVMFNLQMMRLIGEDGVAAITVVMYVNFIFISILLGFSMGTAPIISYHYGADNHFELKNMFKKSLFIVGIVSLAMTGLAQLFAEPIVAMFIGKNAALTAMTIKGFRLYSLAFIVCGFNIFGSAFFTSLCNGTVSATISFLRSLLFPAAIMLILPIFLGLNGIWLTIAVAEALTVIVTLFFFITQTKKYHYA